MAANVRKILVFMEGLKATPTETRQKAQRRLRRKRESLTYFLPVMARPPDDDGVTAS